MGDSSPDFELPDEPMEFDDVSEVSSIIRASSLVSRAEWTLARSDDVDASEIVCTVQEVEEDEVVARRFRAVGHGPRPILEAEAVTVTDGPRVVVTIEI